MKLKMIDYPQLDIPLMPAQLKFKNAPMHNIYCMCAIDYTKLSNGKYLIDKRFKSDFGCHFVFIYNTTEFAKRLSAAINNTGYPVAHGPVRYRPLKEYTGILDDFTKDEAFSWQDEYRFKFYSGLNEKLIIKIGNIAVLMSSETKYLEFEVA